MKIIFIAFAILSCTFLSAQSFPNGSYNFVGDPATAYNKYMVLKNERSFTKVGMYRVLGTSYLFGEKHRGHMYGATEKALNIQLSFNTYNQELTFFTSANPDEGLIKEPGQLDSFLLKSDSLIAVDMFFVHGKTLGSNENDYFCRLTDASKKLVLYKKYKAVLATPANYAESDVREFEIQTSYYYYNKEKQSLTRLKPSYAAVKKELSFIKDIDTLLDRQQFGTDREQLLKNVINSY